MKRWNYLSFFAVTKVGIGPSYCLGNILVADCQHTLPIKFWAYCSGFISIHLKDRR